MAFALGILMLMFAIIGSTYAFSLFGGPTTDFDNKFMSGTFTGEISQNNISMDDSIADWMDSYEDKQRNITYNMSCVKEGEFLTDLYQLQGMAPPEERVFNGVPWKIFYSPAVPTNDANDTTDLEDTSNIVHVYICEADENDASYIINVIAYDNETVDCDGTLYCGLFKDDIQPLLESISFKDAEKAPHMYEVLNITEDDFNTLQGYIEDIKAGNVTEV